MIVFLVALAWLWCLWLVIRGPIKQRINRALNPVKPVPWHYCPACGQPAWNMFPHYSVQGWQCPVTETQTLQQDGHSAASGGCEFAPDQRFQGGDA